jgi:hypothetical protein
LVLNECGSKKTLEYIREREALREQLFRLRGILDVHNASF